MLSKCQIRDTVDETTWHAFLHHFLPCENKLVAIQTDIRYQLGLGPKVPLLSGPQQHSAHPGKAAPPVPQGGSLAGHPPLQASGQGSDWSHLARGTAVVHYPVAASTGYLIWTA